MRQLLPHSQNFSEGNICSQTDQFTIKYKLGEIVFYVQKKKVKTWSSVF